MRSRLPARISGLVVALMVVLAGTILGGGTASASDNVPGSPASSCAGSQVGGSPFNRSTKYGSVKIYVYYSSSNGGTNCIIAKKSGAWAGRKTFMNVAIWRDDARDNGVYPYFAYDSGAYKYYAGAVSIPHTNGRCISALLDLGSGASASTQFNYWSKDSFACG